MDSLISEDYVGYDPTAMPREVHGPDGFKDQTRGYRSAFPDLEFSINSLIAEGDEVVARWTATGTHRQSLMGETPTGKRIQTTGFGSWRIANGRVVEHWGIIDLPGLERQLGVRS